MATNLNAATRIRAAGPRPTRRTSGPDTLVAKKDIISNLWDTSSDQWRVATPALIKKLDQYVAEKKGSLRKVDVEQAFIPKGTKLESTGKYWDGGDKEYSFLNKAGVKRKVSFFSSDLIRLGKAEAFA